jgi:hypothetical protein
VKPLAGLLEQLADELKDKFDRGVCSFDPKWSANRGRLLVLHEHGCPPNVIVKNMLRLIESTRDKITVALRGNSPE